MATKSIRLTGASAGVGGGGLGSPGGGYAGSAPAAAAAPVSSGFGPSPVAVGATSGSAPTNQALIDKLLSSTGSGSSSASAGPSTNTAQTNPDLAWSIQQMKDRYSGDGGAGRAIDLAAGKIREYGEGERRSAAASRTARGVSGTGVNDFDERRISNNVLGQISGASADIAQQREQAKDSMLSNISGVASTSASLAGADRDRALAQWNATEANRRAEEAARLQQTMAIVSLMSRAA